MSLFREHPVRSSAAFAASILLAHLMTRFLSSWHAFHLVQTSVAILAISSLMFLVALHHRREGHLLTQTQEEMVLIGGFALFWLAVLLAWRAVTTHNSVTQGRYGELDTRRSARREPGFTGGVLPYPCASDDVYCVVEEYSFF